jgi:hypothetical protein
MYGLVLGQAALVAELLAAGVAGEDVLLVGTPHISALTVYMFFKNCPI